MTTTPQVQFGNVEPLHTMHRDDPRRAQALFWLKQLPKNATRADFLAMLDRVGGVDPQRTLAAVLTAKCWSFNEAVDWLEKHHA